MAEVVERPGAAMAAHGGLPPAAAARPLPPRTIVPLQGLPIVAAVAVFIVASIATNWTWGLNFSHVVGGALWTSIDLFLGFVVGPIMGKMSIPARIELSTRLMPIMLILMPTVVTMTLAPGWQLATNLGYIDPSYPHHAWIVASFVVVGVMATIAIGVLEPANLAVLFELRKPQPNGELIGKLMQRFIYTAGITGAMQVATLIIMTYIAVK